MWKTVWHCTNILLDLAESLELFARHVITIFAPTNASKLCLHTVNYGFPEPLALHANIRNHYFSNRTILCGRCRQPCRFHVPKAKRLMFFKPQLPQMIRSCVIHCRDCLKLHTTRESKKNRKRNNKSLEFPDIKEPTGSDVISNSSVVPSSEPLFFDLTAAQVHTRATTWKLSSNK